MDKPRNHFCNYQAGVVTKHHSRHEGRFTVTPEDGSIKEQLSSCMMAIPRLEDGQIIIGGHGRMDHFGRPSVGEKVLYIRYGGKMHLWTTLQAVSNFIWRQTGGKI